MRNIGKRVGSAGKNFPRMAVSQWSFIGFHNCCFEHCRLQKNSMAIHLRSRKKQNTLAIHFINFTVSVRDLSSVWKIHMQPQQLDTFSSCWSPASSCPIARALSRTDNRGIFPPTQSFAVSHEEPILDLCWFPHDSVLPPCPPD